MGIFFSSREDGAATWPLASVREALTRVFPSIEPLGEDGPLKVYAVEDDGAHFLVAMMESEAGSGQLVEIGFMARFVDFSPSRGDLEEIARRLRVSEILLERGDVFLLSGLVIAGAFDASEFERLAEAWRGDLHFAWRYLDARDADALAGIIDEADAAGEGASADWRAESSAARLCAAMDKGVLASVMRDHLGARL